jgi:hypothetical protein
MASRSYLVICTRRGCIYHSDPIPSNYHILEASKKKGKKKEKEKKKTAGTLHHPTLSSLTRSRAFPLVIDMAGGVFRLLASSMAKVEVHILINN